MRNEILLAVTVAILRFRQNGMAVRYSLRSMVLTQVSFYGLTARKSALALTAGMLPSLTSRSMLSQVKTWLQPKSTDSRLAPGLKIRICGDSAGFSGT